MGCFIPCSTHLPVAHSRNCVTGKLRTLAALLLTLCATAHSAGAHPALGLSGKVVTIGGQPLAKATVIITARGTTAGNDGALGNSREYRMATTDEGTFAIQGVAAGTYSIRASRIGYAPQSLTVVVGADGVRTATGALLSAPLVLALTEQAQRSPEVIVTATRSPRDAAESASWSSVIPAAEIEAMRSNTAGDILFCRAGLVADYNHGTGVQVQGMDADYTLVLLDGEPLVGRVSGTLDLDRFPGDYIEKVEIVKGPASSLYGSDAMGGVINLITKRPAHPFSSTARIQYGTHNTLEASAIAGTQGEQTGFGLFLAARRSDGYDLDPQTVAPTVYPNQRYTLRPTFDWQLTEQTAYTATATLNTERFSGNTEYLLDTATLIVGEVASQVDWGITQRLTHKFGADVSWAATLYATRYTTEQTLAEGGTEYYRSIFDQLYGKGETQADFLLNEANSLATGGGYILESIRADRIEGDRRTRASWFLFAQDEWKPIEELALVASARYDANNDYAAQFSPKLSVVARPLQWLTLRASAGNGYKAPTFQELYLNFTNPAVGYSVFGATGAASGLAALEQQGAIDAILVSPAGLGLIKPERSFSVNAGWGLQFGNGLRGGATLFRNLLTDMIETLPIARKKNGQNVFTYINRASVVTQGLEAELSLPSLSEIIHLPAGNITLALGYQYLDTYDRDDLKRVQAGDIFKTGSAGQVRPVQPQEYGGLYNRSRHSGTVRLGYADTTLGFTATLQGIARGGYGYIDANSNGILDDDAEYADGYILWNIALNQRLWEYTTLYLGADNLTGVQEPYLPQLSGRTFRVGISARYPGN